MMIQVIEMHDDTEMSKLFYIVYLIFSTKHGIHYSTFFSFLLLFPTDREQRMKQAINKRSLERWMN